MRYKWLMIAAGAGIAFLAEYDPFRDAVRDWVRECIDAYVTQVQYEEAVKQTLSAIRHLPETKEAE